MVVAPAAVPLAPAAETTAPALYVHVPFCDTRCSYCDFYSLPGGRRGRDPSAYLDALDREMAMRVPPGFRPATVFVGGGTPTVLAPDELLRLGAMIRDRIDVSAVREWSVEANPGTLATETIDALLAMGADRVSVGVQSFDDRVLRSVGRIHSGEEAREAVRSLLAAGVPRVSVDLLFAVPGQGIETFTADLDAAIDLGIDHVSCYALLYEEGTALAGRERRGLVRREDEDLELAMLALARARLRAAGFRAYEISNFARPGQECAHNLLYWRNGEYLGIGASAASYLGGERRSNVRDLRLYLDRLAADADPVLERERLDPRGVLGETAMLGLRLDEGIRLSTLAARTGIDAAAEFGPLARRLADAGLAEFDGDRLRLTDAGVAVSDSVAAAFLG